MESRSRSLIAAIVLFAGLTETTVLGASRLKMNSVRNDVSDVTWAHAVNSWSSLEKALAGGVDFLEADISLGHVTGSEEGPAIPIMAHPPDTSSDISLDFWLSTVVKRGPQKGVKLDFKSIEVVEPSLVILSSYASKLNSSVWLNADVLGGPINSPVTPVNADKFLYICQKYFPGATALSTGWTTEWYPTFSEDLWHYKWRHVREMADVIRCGKYDENFKFTFPVRGIFASRSIKELKWLLSEVPESTLTVWTGKYDPLDLQDLLRIRSSFPYHRVYYDVPEKLSTIFREKKTSVDVPKDNVITDDGKWIVLNRGQAKSCSSSTYANKNGIVFGRAATTAVLYRNVIPLRGNDLRITGKIKFFNYGNGSESRQARSEQELKIVLVDVNLLWKNETGNVGTDIDLTAVDGEIIWSAINSSTIYTTRHNYDEHRDDNSCQIFKLDASQDKSFEVWTVSCDAMREESSFEEMSKAGVPAISSRKRLVLPQGPFMLGFVSAGDGHVVIYDLSVDGSTAPAVSPSVVKTPLELFITLLLAIFVFIIS